MAGHNINEPLVIIPQIKLTNGPHYEKKTSESLMIDNSSIKMLATGARNLGTPDYMDASNLELDKSQRKEKKYHVNISDYDCHYDQLPKSRKLAHFAMS